MLRDPRVAIPPIESATLAFAAINLSRTYFPGWGLLYSFLIHGIVLAVLLSLPVYYNPQERTPPPEAESAGKRKQYRVVMFLPSIGGGGQGKESKAESAGDEPSAAPASGAQGLVHPGRQEIRSDPPFPTNDHQTILQPGPEELPVLKSSLDLPNLISRKEAAAAPKPPESSPPMLLPRRLTDLPLQKPFLEFRLPLSNADIGTLFQPDPPHPAVGLPDTLQPEKLQPAELSDGAAVKKLEEGLADLPIQKPPWDYPTPLSIAKLPPPPQPPPAAAQDAAEPLEPAESADIKAEQKPDKPGDATATEPVVPAPDSREPTTDPKAPLASLPLQGKDRIDLLVLSAEPKWPEKPVEIPKAEARGRFAVSPEPNTAGSAEGSLSVSANPSADAASAGGTGASGSGVAGEASGAGSGEGSGSGAGAGTGQGPFVGISIVGGIGGSEPSGPGSGADPGPIGGITVMGGIGASGAAPEPGPPPLPGITVVGGIGETESTANAVPLIRNPRPIPTNYGVSVLSTEDSGGGLPYFGVFSNEQIHTVYLDMRETEADAESVWTFEFAEPRDTSAPIEASGFIEIQPAFSKPLPIVKEKPVLPPEVVRRHLGELVVMYAVISTEGKMEQLSIQQSPDPLLDQPVLEALGKWVFQPGAMNGRPVAVKVLLGIPLQLQAPPG